MKVKLKDSIHILKESEDIYHVVFTSTRKVKSLRFDSLVKKIIDLLKEPSDYDILIRRLNSEHDLDSIRLAVASMQEQGLIRIYSECNERLKKQLYFIDELTESWDETLELQRKISDSSIVVFGCGGIGSWMVNGLHQIGIERLTIVDPDIVEESNLNRQLYFTTKDIGKLKVDVVKERLQNLEIKIDKRRIDDNVSLDDLIEGANLVVNCADSPSVEYTTRVIDKHTRPKGIPYCISGGYNMHLGMVGPIIVPGKTACFECFLDYQKEIDPLKNFSVVKLASDTGSLGPITGAVANIQVMEILKFLIGKGSFNRYAEVDFMDLSVNWKEFTKRDGCKYCS